MNPRSLAPFPALLLLAAGCASEGGEVRRSLKPEQVVRTWTPETTAVETAPAGERPALGRLAALPFFRVVGAEGDSLGCEVCSRRHAGGPNAEESARWMDEELQRRLPAAYREASVPRDLAAAAAAGKGFGGPGAPAPRLEDLRALGAVLKADTVLAGYLFRFREREGAEYGVRTPASVAFELALVGVERGEVLWRGSFDETQESLSENLLRIDRFIQNKGRWAAAGDLAGFGLESLVKSLPPASAPGAP